LKATCDVSQRRRRMRALMIGAAIMAFPRGLFRRSCCGQNDARAGAQRVPERNAAKPVGRQRKCQAGGQPRNQEVFARVHQGEDGGEIARSNRGRSVQFIRHARACRGHPRLEASARSKAWMAGRARPRRICESMPSIALDDLASPRPQDRITQRGLAAFTLAMAPPERAPRSPPDR